MARRSSMEQGPGSVHPYRLAPGRLVQMGWVRRAQMGWARRAQMGWGRLALTVWVRVPTETRAHRVPTETPAHRVPREYQALTATLDRAGRNPRDVDHPGGSMKVGRRNRHRSANLRRCGRRRPVRSPSETTSRPCPPLSCWTSAPARARAPAHGGRPCRRSSRQAVGSQSSGAARLGNYPRAKCSPIRLRVGSLSARRAAAQLPDRQGSQGDRCTLRPQGSTLVSAW